MFGQSLLSAFGIACTTDTDQLFTVPTSSSAVATYELNSNANSIPYNQSATSIATYQLNSGVTSIPNNTYPGTANNITYAAGKFDNAAVFNGSNADIDLPSNIDSTTMSISFWIYIDSTTMSISFWIYIDSIVTGNEVVIELENGYGVWFLANAAGKLGMQSSNANSAHTLSNSQLSAGSWHHIAAVWDGGNRTFYIDNTVQSGGSVTDYLTCNENTIGSRRSGEFFDGKIDQVRIFNSALPQAAITALYNETTTTAQNDYISYTAPSYNGTASNITYAAGKFGNAAQFNGSSSYIPVSYTHLRAHET